MASDLRFCGNLFLDVGFTANKPQNEAMTEIDIETEMTATLDCTGDDCWRDITLTIDDWMMMSEFEEAFRNHLSDEGWDDEGDGLLCPTCVAELEEEDDAD
jgi:hypothetical protein